MTSEGLVLVPIVPEDNLPAWSKANRFSSEFRGMQKKLQEKYLPRGSGLIVPIEELREVLDGIVETLDERIIIPKTSLHEIWRVDTDNKETQRLNLTANATKLMQDQPRLERLKTGQTPSPLTVHFTPTNVCNFKCRRCCCADRRNQQNLRPEQSVKGLVATALLGAGEVEISGGGEPTLYPYFPYIVELSKALGLNIGLYTNGSMLHKFPQSMYEGLKWLRYDIYNHEAKGKENMEDGFVNMDTIRLIQDAGVSVSAGYVFDLTSSVKDDNPNETGNWLDKGDKIPRMISLEEEQATWTTFNEMLDWVDTRAKIPVRLTPNGGRPRLEVQRDIDFLNELVDIRYRGSETAPLPFVPPIDTDRGFDDCFIHLVKPVITPAPTPVDSPTIKDGWVVVCPCFVHAPENGFTHQNPRFKVCDVDNMLEYYEHHEGRRHQGCSNCTFAAQNRFLKAMLTSTS